MSSSFSGSCDGEYGLHVPSFGIRLIFFRSHSGQQTLVANSRRVAQSQALQTPALQPGSRQRSFPFRREVSQLEGESVLPVSSASTLLVRTETDGSLVPIPARFPAISQPLLSSSSDPSTSLPTLSTNTNPPRISSPRSTLLRQPCRVFLPSTFASEESISSGTKGSCSLRRSERRREMRRAWF